MNLEDLTEHEKLKVKGFFEYLRRTAIRVYTVNFNPQNLLVFGKEQQILGTIETLKLNAEGKLKLPFLDENEFIEDLTENLTIKKGPKSDCIKHTARLRFCSCYFDIDFKYESQE